LAKIISIALFGLLISLSALGNIDGDTTEAAGARSDKRYIPHFVPIQHAGNIGYFSTGVGYAATRDKVHFSLQYGYTPKSVGGIELHALTVRNIFHLYKFYVKNQTVIPYAALGLSWDVGGRSFFFIPDNMPRGYYKFPKSVHAIPAVGIKLRHKTKQIKMLNAIEIFAEATTVDAYIWYRAISSEVATNDIVSLSVGANLMRK
jgi:hypothetical protein